MDKGVLATIAVAIIGASGAVITTQIQETSRFETAVAVEERKHRTSLILAALAAPEAADAAEALRFFADLGLLGEELGARSDAYLAGLPDEDDAPRRIPAGLPAVLDQRQVSPDVFEAPATRR